MTGPRGKIVVRLYDHIANKVKFRTILATSSGTGAVAIPNDITPASVLQARYSSASAQLGLVFHRGDGYLSCKDNDMQAVANKSLLIDIVYAENIVDAT